MILELLASFLEVILLYLLINLMAIYIYGIQPINTFQLEFLIYALIIKDLGDILYTIKEGKT